jgi:sigma-E factor negative regulatory protein RseB
LIAVRWRPLILVGPAVALASATFAPTAAGAGGSAQHAPTDTRGWLMRVHGAASQRNYQGTLVVSARGMVSSSKVAHYCEGEQRFERVEALDGPPRQVLRHNDQVHTLWPARRVVVVEQRDRRNAFPALLSGSEEQAFERYELKAEADDRVAGHATAVFLLQPRDAHRYPQRLWADKATGLLLRNDVLDERGQVLESTAFTDVAIDVPSQAAGVMKAMRRTDGWQVQRPALARTRLEAEGWSLVVPVSGFREISCVRREAEGVEGGLLQTIYADGLTHVSVFVEPYRAERHRPVQAAIGATQTLMMQRGDWWITVVGDVPAATLHKFAQALERRR